MREPRRLCVACRQQKNKDMLIRVAFDDRGLLVIDHNGRMQTRGAYICPSLSCIETAKKKHSFDKSFKTEVENDVYDELKELIDE